MTEPDPKEPEINATMGDWDKGWDWRGYAPSFPSQSSQSNDDFPTWRHIAALFSFFLGCALVIAAVGVAYEEPTKIPKVSCFEDEAVIVAYVWKDDHHELRAVRCLPLDNLTSLEVP